MSLCQNLKFRRSVAVASQEIASATLVVLIRDGAADLDAVFSFNPIGAELWKLMERSVTVGEMASWVESRYDISRETALEDIQKFVDALVAAGLATESFVGPALGSEVHTSSRN